MNDTFEQLQKTAEEGAKKWEHIEKLVENLKFSRPMQPSLELLLALVDYMRPMAPNPNSVSEATKDIQDLLGKIMGKNPNV